MDCGGWKAEEISGAATAVLLETSEKSSSSAEVLESSAPSFTPASGKFL
jgi:hypothetical protein